MWLCDQDRDEAVGDELSRFAVRKAGPPILRPGQACPGDSASAAAQLEQPRRGRPPSNDELAMRGLLLI